MAEAQVPDRPRGARKPRSRARVGRTRPVRKVTRHLGLGFFVLLTIVALGLLAAGLIAGSQTIFATGGGSGKPIQRALVAPAKSPHVSSLVGSPVDGSIVAVSVAEDLVAIQPADGSPVQALVNSSSKITRGGVAVSLASLIPGEAVVVTFSQGPDGTLIVAQLQDIESLPTNTPSPTYTPTPYQYSAPSARSTAIPGPTPAGPPGPGNPAPGGPP